MKPNVNTVLQMNKEKALQEISEELLSRSILSEEDISNIVSVHLNILIDELIKDKLTIYEQKRIDLQASRKGLSGKKLASVVKQQQLNNLLIKKYNLELDKAQKQMEHRLLIDYVKNNIGIEFLIGFYKSIDCA